MNCLPCIFSILHISIPPPRTEYTGSRNPLVERVGWSDDTVWLDVAKTIAKTTHREHYRATAPGQCGFRGVSEKVWEFQIGSFQVCHKWLYDRRGRTLSDKDIRHYQKIIVVINETLRIMPEIDDIIERHGRWPGAFHDSTKDR